MRRPCLLLIAALTLASPLSGQPRRITDTAGQPVPGARVEIWTPPERQDLLGALQLPVAAGETGEAGTLPRYPKLPRLLLTVDHPSFAPLGTILDPSTPATLRLPDGFAWEGRVAFQGEPPASGEVCARWEEEFSGWQRSVTWKRCALLDPEGKFVLRGLPQGRVQIHLEAPGYLPLDAEGDPRKPPALRLQPGVVIEGSVLSAHGREPIPGATVRAPGSGSATSGSDGTFRLAVPALPVALEAVAPGHHKAALRVPQPEQKPPGERAVFILAPREQLRGVLVGSGGGSGLGDPSVWIEQRRPEGSSRLERKALTLDEEGRFLLELNGPGSYHLRFRAAGHRDRALPPLEVMEGAVESVGTVLLDRGASLRGQLLHNEDGTPVEGADVRLLPLGLQLLTALQREESHREVSDGEGIFALEGLPEGGFELRIRHGDHAPLVEEVHLGAKEQRDLGVLHLSPGVRLRGRVVDREENPRRGLRIILLPLGSESLLPLVERTTDDRGEFVVDRQPAGRFQVEVHGQRLLLAQEVEIPEGGDEVPLELSVGGVRLGGRVVRGDLPVAGGVIRLSAVLDPAHRQGKIQMQAATPGGPAFRHGMEPSSLSAEVAEDGTFQVDDAPAGALWATYLGADHPVTRQIYVPDASAAEIVLDLAGASRVAEVVDGETGAGIASALRVVDPLGAVVARYQAPDGRFAVEDLAPGRYLVEASSPGYISATVRDVPIDGAQPPLRIPLDRGEPGGLTVKLRWPSGEGAAGIPVTILRESGLMALSSLTDGSGRREFRNLAPGRYFAVWSDAFAGAGIAGPVLLDGEQPRSVVETLGKGSTLRVRCDPELCQEGRIDALAVFSASGVDLSPYLSGVSSGLRLAADGLLTVGRLAPGAYHLALWTRGQRLDRSVTLEGDGATVRLP